MYLGGVSSGRLIYRVPEDVRAISRQGITSACRRPISADHRKGHESTKSQLHYRKQYIHIYSHSPWYTVFRNGARQNIIQDLPQTNDVSNHVSKPYKEPPKQKVCQHALFGATNQRGDQYGVMDKRKHLNSVACAFVLSEGRRIEKGQLLAVKRSVHKHPSL